MQRCHSHIKTLNGLIQRGPSSPSQARAQRLLPQRLFYRHRASSLTREQVSVKLKSQSGKVNRLVLFGPGGGVGGGVPQNEKNKGGFGVKSSFCSRGRKQREKKKKRRKERTGTSFLQQLCLDRSGLSDGCQLFPVCQRLPAAAGVYCDADPPLSASNTRLMSANDDSLGKHECAAPPPQHPSPPAVWQEKSGPAGHAN